MQLLGKNWSVLLGVLVLLSIIGDVICSRAFPVPAVRWVVKHFQQINRNLEWDPTNYLIDLSGKYAKCRKRHERGFFKVDHRAPYGDSIGGLRDQVRGDEPYADSVEEYIRKKLKHWTKEEPYLSQIVTARRFGCSVKPMCDGHAVMACLFSHEYDGGDKGQRDNSQRDNGRYRYTTCPPCRDRTHPPTWPPIRPTRPPIRPPRPRPTPRRPTRVKVRARAFTKPQYSLAERITNQQWDRSYFLEALSGTETTCSMVHMARWKFPFAGMHAKRRGMVVKGLYGHHPNEGATQPAMEKIMKHWGKMSAKKVGCSVIPDCPGNRQHPMMVVVSCLFKM